MKSISLLGTGFLAGVLATAVGVVVMMPRLRGGAAAVIAYGQVTSMEISSNSRPRRTSWLRVWQTGQR